MSAQYALRNSIGNQEIHHVIALRNTCSALKRRLEMAQNELDSAENEVIRLMRSGASNSTSYEICLKEEARRSVPWKSVVANILGHEKCEQILKETIPTISLKLLIKDR
jgi:hypothetical protein